MRRIAAQAISLAFVAGCDREGRDLNAPAQGCGMCYVRIVAALWVLGAFCLSEHISVITRAARHLGVAGGILAGVARIGGLALLWRHHRDRSPTNGNPES